MAKPKNFKVGDRVYVTRAPGKTMFEITYIADNGWSCMLRQTGIAPNGKPYRESPFDLSLLFPAGDSK